MALRIISGTHRGRRIQVPKGRTVRPTSDRLRESIFNILAHEVREAGVLDLFAGSGALGLEALSRGAAHVVFVDVSATACRCIQSNITACGGDVQSRVIRWDAAKNLNILDNVTHRFDLVFMDPPYGRDLIRPTLVHLSRCTALTPGARVVVEHTEDEPPDPRDLPLVVDARRKVGKSLVAFLRFVL